ncbi:MAG: PHP domain-containing protein [Acidilobus sp.]
MPCLVELHCHSTISDGRPTPEEIVLAAARLGLSAVAISDHNTFRGSAAGLKAARGMELGISVIPANEVRTSKGDVLVLCPSLPEEDPEVGIDPYELRAWSDDRGCVMIAAHPFQPGRKGVGLYLRKHHRLFNAIEVWNARGLPPLNYLAERFARSRGIPMTSGSDAHVLSELGEAPTLIRLDDCSPEGVVEAIRKGLSEPTRGYMRPRALVDALEWSVLRRLSHILGGGGGVTSGRL